MVTNVRHRRAPPSAPPSPPPSLLVLLLPLARVSPVAFTANTHTQAHARTKSFLLLYGFNKSPRGNSRWVGTDIKLTASVSSTHSIQPPRQIRRDTVQRPTRSGHELMAEIERRDVCMRVTSTRKQNRDEERWPRDPVSIFGAVRPGDRGTILGRCDWWDRYVYTAANV